MATNRAAAGNAKSEPMRVNRVRWSKSFDLVNPKELSYRQRRLPIFDTLFPYKIREWITKHLWLYLGLVFVGLTSIAYAASFLINDETDWRILLFLNPDSPVPVLDDLMILITDFSMLGFGLLFVFWEIGYQTSKRTQVTKENVEKILRIVGLIFFFFISSAYFWAGYEHSTIFFPLALVSFGAFWFIGTTMTRYGEEKLQQINRLFWITLLATLLTELAAEVIIKNVVARPRPLSDVWAAYNGGIRTVADEIVRCGHSFVAGHSAVFFAMTMPITYFASKRWVKAGLFIWASVHALTRVYLAAHFPYCTLIGAGLGFSMATLVVGAFGTFEKQEIAS